MVAKIESSNKTKKKHIDEYTIQNVISWEKC